MIAPSDVINGKPVRGQGVCGVVAVANVTGLKPQTVFNRYRCPSRPRWRGALHSYELMELMNRLRVGWDEQKFERCTLQRFIDWYAAKGATYIVNTTGHYVVVKGGKVYDQGGEAEVSEHFCRRRNVKRAWKITAKRRARK